MINKTLSVIRKNAKLLTLSRQVNVDDRKYLGAGLLNRDRGFDLPDPVQRHFVT